MNIVLYIFINCKYFSYSLNSRGPTTYRPQLNDPVRGLELGLTCHLRAACKAIIKFLRAHSLL